MNLGQIEEGVYQIPIQLPDSLEPQRLFFQESILAAQRRLRKFAQKYYWQDHTKEPFASKFLVFADKASFDRNLLEVCELDTTIELPATYCAAIEQGILMAVSPELYRSIYPDGDEENAYEKLLTHEIAHRLHIRILNGDEDAMGDVWFYEGFALYAAGQFEKNAPSLSGEEIWAIVKDLDRGSYRRYASVFQYFVKKAPIQKLVEMANKDNFLDWLQKISK